jgi:uncharacterized membrane protein YphA (DoxX/SURF4 family)
MLVIFDILSVVLAVICLGSAFMDFKGHPQVLEVMERLGYKPGFQRTLGLIKILAAVGLLIGLGVHYLGDVALVGLVVYFFLAVRAHRKVEDSRQDTLPATLLLALSGLTLVVGLLS